MRRFNTTYCEEKYHDGFKHDWYAIGYGLPFDGSSDAHFLSHVFGHDIGKPKANNPTVKHKEVIASTTQQLLSTKLKPGRKQAYEKGEGATDMKRRVGTIVRSEPQEEDEEEDIRIEYLKNLRHTTNCFAHYIRQRFGFQTPDDFYQLSSKVQEAVMTTLAFSNAWCAFDTRGGVDDESAMVACSKHRMAADEAFAEVLHMCDADEMQKVIRTTAREVAHDIKLEAARQLHFSVMSLSVAQLRSILKQHGLATSGKKAKLIERLKASKSNEDIKSIVSLLSDRMAKLKEVVSDFAQRSLDEYEESM